MVAPLTPHKNPPAPQHSSHPSVVRRQHSQLQMSLALFQMASGALRGLQAEPQAAAASPRLNVSVWIFRVPRWRLRVAAAASLPVPVHFPHLLLNVILEHSVVRDSSTFDRF